ncbi:hypothetical protein SVIRM249S_02145 [Streptomyces viridochromogenes]
MTAAPVHPARSVLACGEVRTCLLPSLQALDIRAAAQLLRLRADEPVRLSERPSMHALSPAMLTGVDCRLPSSNGSKVRGVGTVAARAALTEGRLLQATAWFSVPATGPDLRRPWGQYLVRPGLVEPFGKLPEQATADGVLRGAGRGELGAAGGPSVIETLQPVVVHLLHLWMPRAHVDPALAHLWDVLEERPGFSRQWENLSRRIRDRLALQAVAAPQQALSDAR